MLPSLREWIHVAATYDGSQLKLYQDGELVGSKAVSGAIAHNAGVQVTIGDNPTADRPFDGRIDELRLEPRALSQAEREEQLERTLAYVETARSHAAEDPHR